MNPSTVCSNSWSTWGWTHMTNLHLYVNRCKYSLHVGFFFPQNQPSWNGRRKLVRRFQLYTSFYGHIYRKTQRTFWKYSLTCKNRQWLTLTELRSAVYVGPKINQPWNRTRKLKPDWDQPHCQLVLELSFKSGPIHASNRTQHLLKNKNNMSVWTQSNKVRTITSINNWKNTS